MLLTGIKFVLRFVKFRLLLGIKSRILADIFFGPEKTGPKINPAKQIDVIDYNNMLSTNLKIYLLFEFVDFVLLQAFL